jgi:hypothetical protein
VNIKFFKQIFFDSKKNNKTQKTNYKKFFRVMALRFLSHEVIPYFNSNKRISDSSQYLKYIKIMRNALINPDKFFTLAI